MQLKRITVTLPAGLAAQLENLRFTERISVSSMAEVALRAYLRAYAEVAGDSLRAAGATLRRRRNPRRAAPVSLPSAEQATQSAELDEAS